MKIAWVCEYPASSFADRPKLARAGPSHPVPWIAVQAPLVARAGVELHVITLSKDALGDDEFEKEGVHFHVLRIPRVPRALLGYQLDRRRIHTCLAAVLPEIVQGFGTESGYGYCAVSSRYPAVLMIQGILSRIVGAQGAVVPVRNPRLLVPLVLERVTVRRCRHFVCETGFAAGFVREINPTASIQIIRTPVRDEFFGVKRRGDADGPEILFVGWVTAAKGVDLLVDAFSTILRELPRATLHIVGPAEPAYVKTALAPLLARPGVADRVRMHGHQSPGLVMERLATAAVLALPTRMDTAPNVLAEARAAGVPVVAAAVGGIPELVEDGVDGLLVPPESAPGLAEAILRLLRDDGLAGRIGLQGRARALRDHRAATQVPKLIDLYREILTPPAS